MEKVARFGSERVWIWQLTAPSDPSVYCTTTVSPIHFRFSHFRQQFIQSCNELINQFFCYCCWRCSFFFPFLFLLNFTCNSNLIIYRMPHVSNPSQINSRSLFANHHSFLCIWLLLFIVLLWLFYLLFMAYCWYYIIINKAYRREYRIMLRNHLSIIELNYYVIIVLLF